MLYILLPVHNREKITSQFLKDVANQKGFTYDDIHVLLVDDGCTDETVLNAKKIAEKNFQITIIEGSGHLYWGGGLEAARKRLSEFPVRDNDIVLISNDDNRMSKDYFSKAIDFMRASSERKIMLAAFRKNSSHSKIKGPGIIFHPHEVIFSETDEIDNANCVNTQSLFMYAKEFLSLGHFYPRMIPHFLADYEFTYRASRKGFKILATPNVSIEYDPKTTWNQGNSNIKTISKRFNFLFSARNPNYLPAWLFIAWKYASGTGYIWQVVKRIFYGILFVVRDPKKK